MRATRCPNAALAGKLGVAFASRREVATDEHRTAVSRRRPGPHRPRKLRPQSRHGLHRLSERRHRGAVRPRSRGPGRRGGPVRRHTDLRRPLRVAGARAPQSGRGRNVVAGRASGPLAGSNRGGRAHLLRKAHRQVARRGGPHAGRGGRQGRENRYRTPKPRLALPRLRPQALARGRHRPAAADTGLWEDGRAGVAGRTRWSSAPTSSTRCAL